MLLVLRSLLFEPATKPLTGGTHRGTHRKRPRRIAEWSEVKLPFVRIPLPKAEDVVIVGTPITLNPQIGIGEVVAEVALFAYEKAALADLLEFLEIEKQIAEVDAASAAIDRAAAPFPDWDLIEMTRT